MIDDLIRREAAIEAVKIPDDGCSNPSERYGIIFARVEARRAIRNLPSAPAVPLEPLAKWIVENLDPRCGCSYCSRDRVCCDCPTMTEQQVKEELTKWMEEQGPVCYWAYLPEPPKEGKDNG